MTRDSSLHEEETELLLSRGGGLITSSSETEGKGNEDFSGRELDKGIDFRGCCDRTC